MNNISAITCVISSRNTDKEKQEFLDNLRETCGYNLNVMFMINSDGVSLTKIYSEMVEKSNDDIIVFVHDDVEFLKPGWGFELIRLFDKYKDYGIIGVAGSAEFDSKGAWWNYDKKYGQVLHRSNGKSWLTAFSPLLKEDLQEVCVIDGLFMAVHKGRISKNFDTEFQGFNFYDISMCLSNYVDGKCKIGVTTNIRLAHNSVGETKQNWFDNLVILNEKYNEYYPFDVEKDRKRRDNENKIVI